MNYSIFISQNVPNSDVKKYKVSQAANNFCLHINNLQYFSHHIAVPPANVDGTFVNHTDNELNIEYHLCRKIKHCGIGKKTNTILDNLWIYKRVIKAKEQNVWFYNVWTGNLLAYFLVLLLSTKNVYILLADYNPSRYNNVVGKILLWAISKAKGVISLSARCKEVNKEFCSIPGIIPEKKIRKTMGSCIGKNKFLLSGTLNENTGLFLALDVFKNLPGAKLYLSGILSEDCKKKVEDICSKYNNIEYKGFFEKYSDYLDFIQGVDITLSLRNPDSPVNHYNFPSKILETLAYNKVVLSTIEYPELDGVNYLLAPYNKECLKLYIQEIITGRKDSEIEKCLDNTDVLTERYSEKAWIEAFKKMESK